MLEPDPSVLGVGGLPGDAPEGIGECHQSQVVKAGAFAGDGSLREVHLVKDVPNYGNPIDTGKPSLVTS